MFHELAQLQAANAESPLLHGTFAGLFATFMRLQEREVPAGVAVFAAFERERRACEDLALCQVAPSHAATWRLRRVRPATYATHATSRHVRHVSSFPAPRLPRLGPPQHDHREILHPQIG